MSSICPETALLPQGMQILHPYDIMLLPPALAGSPPGQPHPWRQTSLPGSVAPWTPDNGDTPLTPGGAPPHETPARRRCLLRSTASRQGGWVLPERTVTAIGNAKRIRNERLSFRLTKEERAAFDVKWKLSGLPIHAFIMKCICKQNIIIRPGADLLIVQIKRVGNNLNQIAHKVNAGQIRDCSAELQSIRDELRKLREAWQL